MTGVSLSRKIKGKINTTVFSHSQYMLDGNFIQPWFSLLSNENRLSIHCKFRDHRKSPDGSLGPTLTIPNYGTLTDDEIIQKLKDEIDILFLIGILP